MKLQMRNPAEGANRWREQYNPLRSLTLTRAVSMLENAQRGIFPETQWTYSFIERRDPDLRTLIERRSAALLEMEWKVKIWAPEKFGKLFDQLLAEEQQGLLSERYNSTTNLQEAVQHLALATWRGYSFLQDRDVAFEILDSWNFCRDGLYGDWFWNPDARDVPTSSLPPENRLDLAALKLVCMEDRRPIDEIAVVKYVRQSLSEKDWDAFIEIYGLPGWLIIAPPNLPDSEKTDFEDAAEDLAEGASGTLPNGSDAKCADQPRGVQPFQTRLDWLTQKLVLAGTGGLLTMLTAPGSGTLAGSAHMEAFRILAAGEAKRISEVFQKQRDVRILAKEFPDKPILAYFDLCAKESRTAAEVIADAVALRNAGYTVDLKQLAERTGYTLQTVAVPPAFAPQAAAEAPVAGPTPAPAPIPVGDAAAEDEDEFDAEAVAEAVANRVRYAAGIEDATFRANAITNLVAELPTLLQSGSAGKPPPAMANAAAAPKPAAAPFAPAALAAELGVPATWLAPVETLLADLERKAADATLSDADFAAFLADAVVRVPELFADMDVSALADVFAKAGGAAVLEGARAGMRKGAA